MPAPLYTAKGFDRSAIMRRAWTLQANEIEAVAKCSDYGPEIGRARITTAQRREMFAAALRWAWTEAKRQRQAAQDATEKAARVAAIPASERVARAEALHQQATCIEMLDRNGSGIARAARMRREAEALAIAA